MGNQRWELYSCFSAMGVGFELGLESQDNQNLMEELKGGRGVR